MTESLKTGTTTVGIITNEAVVLGSDQQATMWHLAAENEMQKIYPINEMTAITIAGSAGDGLTLVKFLRTHSKLYEMERETIMRTKALVSLLANVFSSNRFYPFYSHFLVGGFSSKPELFNVTPDGAALEQKKYSWTGSGSELALSVLDNDYKENMTEKDGILLALKALKTAKKRDIYTGGQGFNITVITKQGVKELTEKEVSSFLKEK
ncbi:MAG: proteasome subunit beta [archaeon]